MTRIDVQATRQAIARHDRAADIEKIVLPILKAAGAHPDEVIIKPDSDFHANPTTLIHFQRDHFNVTQEVSNRASDYSIEQIARYLAAKVAKAPRRKA